MAKPSLTERLLRKEGFARARPRLFSAIAQSLSLSLRRLAWAESIICILIFTQNLAQALAAADRSRIHCVCHSIVTDASERNKAVKTIKRYAVEVVP